MCIFENCQPPDYNDRHQLTCINGAWAISAVSTCQAGACPDAPPIPGSTCDAGFTPGPCSFTDACGASHEVLCVQGSWQSIDAEEDRAAPPDSDVPEAPLCPTYPPFFGDPCCPANVPEVCDYTQGSTDGAAGASFLIAPPDTSGGAAEPPPTLYCAVCTPQMTWDYCPLE